MAGRKGGLGKGLDSLIPSKPVQKETAAVVHEPEKDGGGVQEEKGGGTLYVSIEKVEPNRNQPRKAFDEDALLELSESIKRHGVLSPLLVKKQDDYYEIIAGERRWRAAKKAGLDELPIIIKELTDQETVEVSLIENIQREDLNPIEEAQAYKRLMDEFHLKQDEIAEKVSKSRTAVTNTMRLLKLDERVQQMLVDEMITSGHARAILGLEDHNRQYEFAQKVFDEKLSVREVEREIKNLIAEKKTDENPKKTKDLNPQITAILGELEEKLKQIFETKVSVVPKDEQRGRIQIEYYSQEGLNEFIKKISM